MKRITMLTITIPSKIAILDKAFDVLSFLFCFINFTPT